MDKPLVSVIIPNRNGERYLRQAIESALQQTYAAVEVLVVDDGSTDTSPAILGSFGAAIRSAQAGGGGAPAARNIGWRQACGELIKFLDSDDFLLPDCLERQVRQSSQLLGVRKAIVYGDAIWIDSAGRQIPGFSHRSRRAGEDPIAHMLRQSPLTSCPLHKRTHLTAVDGFDPTLARGQEHDLHVRLAAAGVEFVHRPGAVYMYREHGDPARISNRAITYGDPLQQLKTLKRQLATLESSAAQPLSSQVYSAFAQRMWLYGRAVLREGFAVEALRYFASANALDPKRCIAGNPPYPALVRLLGPVQAERMMARLRKVVARQPIGAI